MGFNRGELVNVKALLETVRHLDTGTFSSELYVFQLDKASAIKLQHQH
jgi:hypothetical protein